MATNAGTVSEARTETPPASRIPNLAGRRFGTGTPGIDEVEKRVVRKTGPEVPVAAFQSSI